MGLVPKVIFGEWDYIFGKILKKYLVPFMIIWFIKTGPNGQLLVNGTGPKGQFLVNGTTYLEKYLRNI